MEERLDIVNRSFHEARGLLPSEVFEGLPAGIVPSITVVRARYEEKEGSPLLLAHAGQSGDVADPWYTGDFEATWQDVNIGCRALLKELTEKK